MLYRVFTPLSEKSHTAALTKLLQYGLQVRNSREVYGAPVKNTKLEDSIIFHLSSEIPKPSPKYLIKDFKIKPSTEIVVRNNGFEYVTSIKNDSNNKDLAMSLYHHLERYFDIIGVTVGQFPVPMRSATFEEKTEDGMMIMCSGDADLLDFLTKQLMKDNQLKRLELSISAEEPLKTEVFA